MELRIGAVELLLWNTFLGSTGMDGAAGIATDESGSIYVTGASSGPWGNPINPHAGLGDAFISKLSIASILI